MTAVKVRSDRGIVILRGGARNFCGYARAARIARTVRGVRAVVNLIEMPSKKRSDQQIEQDLRAAFQKAGSTDRLEISAEVKNGEVTLTGNIHSWQEKPVVVQIAKSVTGVTKVYDRSEVISIESRPDKQIEAEIKRLLAWDVWVEQDRIDVEVRDGRVRLKGYVSNAEEKIHVLKNAWVTGVVTVEAQDLRITPSKKGALRKPFAFDIRSGNEIKTAVEDALSRDPRVEVEGLQIDVDAVGNVTLRGVVDNRGQRDAAEQDARNAVGVFTVKNELKIRR